MAYPTSIATDADLYLAKNQLATQLNGSIDAVVTTITVDSTTGFPTVGTVTIDSEVIKYTGLNATQFTGCTRGFDGTGATTHADNAPVRHAVTAIHHNALKDELIAVETHNIPGQRTGTATNDSAAAGKTGEYIESVVAAVAFPATTAYGDAASISLTAGDWDVSANVLFSGGTTNASWYTGISTTSGNSNAGLVLGSNFAAALTAPTATNAWAPIVAYRISLTATTTIYLKYRADYTGSVPTLYGRLSARRVR